MERSCHNPFSPSKKLRTLSKVQKMDRLCLNALREYILRVTDEKTSELFNWLHLKVIYKSLGIGDQKVDDQKKMNLVSQFQTTITDQVS